MVFHVTFEIAAEHGNTAARKILDRRTGKKCGNLPTGFRAWHSQLRAGLFLVTVVTLSLRCEEPLSARGKKNENMN
jgi:hypothetical protein